MVSSLKSEVRKTECDSRLVRKAKPYLGHAGVASKWRRQAAVGCVNLISRAELRTEDAYSGVITYEWSLKS